MVKNIKIQFVNGDTLTYESDESYASVKDLRKFIGGNTCNYHFDLIDSRGKKIVCGTIDDNLTCVYTEPNKCVECECINETYVNGLCCDCYLDGDYLSSVYTPNYKLYRVSNPNQTEYCAYKVYFDDDGEQVEIQLINEDNTVFKYLPLEERLMTDESGRDLILESKVPDVFLDKFWQIRNDDTM